MSPNNSKATIMNKPKHQKNYEYMLYCMHGV